jgi:hypothetical protein
MLGAKYLIRQAEVAARFALAESDPAKSASLHLLALEHYEKAEKANSGNSESRGRELLGESREASPISNSATLGR